MDQDRVLAAHPLSIFALQTSVIANVAAAVRLGVGVDDLAPESGLGNTEPIIMMHHRRGVYYERDHVAGTRFSQECHYAVVGIVKIDPVKTFVGVVLVP